MKREDFSDDRTFALALLRRWGREAVNAGVPVRRVHRELMECVRSVIGEFRVEHDVPGVRYWHVPEDGSYFTSEPGSRPDASRLAGDPIELKRYEFLSRQGLHFGYEDRL